MTDFPDQQLLSGTGKLVGPPSGALFFSVMEFLKTQLPLFAENIVNTDIHTENGLNSCLSRFITNAADGEVFFSERERMEDETRGDSPAADIGIFLKVADTRIDPPLITVLEGKRLTKGLRIDRRREYVIGHEKKGKHIPCGGIERFKKSIHGRELTHAGMIGYIQDEKQEYWLGQINSWISELSLQQDSKWLEEELLAQITTEKRISESASIVCRQTDKLHLTHLWINLVA